jgi:diguanylate cyclase (GGDEF)-like protein/PAS domain S-box-containing protein
MLIATLLVAAIFVVMMAGVSRLGGHAERDWKIATDVTALQANVHRLSALEWQAVAENEVSPAAHRDVGATLLSSRLMLGRLRGRSDSAALERFALDFERYAGAVEHEFALLELGRVHEAEQIDEELVDPAFAVVTRASAASVAAHRADARRSGATARTGSVLLGALALALILGLVARFHHTGRALAAARASERARRDGEAWLRGLLGNASDTVVVTDAAGRLTWVSETVEPLIGVPASQVVGTVFTDHMEDPEAAVHKLSALAGDPGAHDELRVRLKRAGGRGVDVEARVTNLLDHPTVGGIVVNIRDVSDRTALEGRLRHQALHDPLTGLANRALFEDRLQHALASAGRAGRHPAVLFCDLDDFKTINDSLGHEAGDALLEELGRRLAATLRDADSVARLGGDEFAVLVEDADDADDVVAVAERVLEAIAAPVDLLGRELAIHGSIGIAMSDKTTDAQTLLRQADVAMYAAKSDGKGRFRLFEQRMHEAVVQRLELKADLSRAVDRGELFLAYQPIVAVDSSRLVGVEALVRWRHPARGVVAPDAFIPMAEESGLIIPIGRWVLQEATRQFAQWKRERPHGAPGHISVNVAGAQLHDPAFADDVASAIAHAGLLPGELILEVTESSLIDDDGSEASLAELRALGTRLAIDDFGSGYSALNYLRRFPMDILKIDRSFVDGVTTVARDAALTRAMIAMAAALGLDVVAEGVEREDQLSALQALHCGMAQGFLFSRPVAAAEVLALIDAADVRADAA